MSEEQTPLTPEPSAPTILDRIDALYALTDVSTQAQIQFRELVEIVRAMATPQA